MTASVALESPASAAAEALGRARDHLLGLQSDSGWWKAELETNVTMEAEDLLLRRVRIGLWRRRPRLLLFLGWHCQRARRRQRRRQRQRRCGRGRRWQGHSQRARRERRFEAFRRRRRRRRF